MIDVQYASLTSQGVQHRVFYLDGHPSRYQPRPTGLNFGEQTGTGVFPLVIAVPHSFPSWSSVFSLLVVAHNRNYGYCHCRNRTILNSGFLYGQLVRRQYTWLHVETLLRAYWQIDANGVKLSELSH